MKEYALYHGDNFIDLGTADYLSRKYNISKKTIYWYSCRPVFERRENSFSNFCSDRNIIILIED